MAKRFLFGLAFAGPVLSQIHLAAPYSSGFNSTFTLTSRQIEDARLDPVLAESIQTMIRFERTQLVSGGPRHDDFYTLPTLNTTALQPGVLLKVQTHTDPTSYALPPNTALSRILYTTTDANGTVIPTSGFLLWPFLAAHAVNNKAPLVVWLHGTSGFFGSQAPSAHRWLWYGASGPFALAQAGHVVFAPDYAGLGVPSMSSSWNMNTTTTTKAIPHQYHLSRTTARDALFGVRAALAAFPDKLAPRFVALGHSQGGGAAWALAEELARDASASSFPDLSAAYRGAVAASPTTRVFSGPQPFMAAAVALHLASLFPGFVEEDWLTPLGAARARLARDIEGGVGVLASLLFERPQREILRADWDRASWYADAFAALGDAGGKRFTGPLLVVQGTEDGYVPYSVTAETVGVTAGRFLGGEHLEFLVARGVGHVPVLEATRARWLAWIADRLEAKPVARRGFVRTEVSGFVAAERYLKTANSVPLWAGLPEYEYQVALSV